MRLGTRDLSFACLLALLMAGLGLAGGGALADDGKKWTAEDYRTRAVDHTFFSFGGTGDGMWKSLFYYHPDGTALSKAWGKGWKRRATGTWKIKDDRFCTEYDRKAWRGACHEFFDRSENAVISKVGRGTNEEKTLLLKIVGKGNVKNLQ